MARRNVVLISLDEVRPDRLSCYGYANLETRAIDRVAAEGVRFETCISSSDFTPVAMGSVLTGRYPDRHGMRDPYMTLQAPTMAGILKRHGYLTCGWTGNGLTTEKHGWREGFDIWHEPTSDTSWMDLTYPGANQKEDFLVGYYWVDDFFEWFRQKPREPFFIWGHLLETHEGSEEYLLRRGLIPEGELSEHSYADAKVKMADEKLIGRLLERISEHRLDSSTILVVMSDHGANLGEHPEVDLIPWRPYKKKYPQHTTMYDVDLRVALIIRADDLPKGTAISGMVRSIDVVPTLLELLDLPREGCSFDGSSLLSEIQSGHAEGREVYAEDIMEARGKGFIQALRTDTFKYMRNLSRGTEAYFDLRGDPGEQRDVLHAIEPEKLVALRRKLNGHLDTKVGGERQIPESEKATIDDRLRRLGYIR